MPANFRKEGRTFKSKNGLVEYQYGDEYVDDREYLMNMGGMASEAGDFRRRPDESGGGSATAVMKNGGVTNLELARRGMGGTLNPVTSARSGKVVPGMYQSGGESGKSKELKWEVSDNTDTLDSVNQAIQDGMAGNDTKFNTESYGKRHNRLREKGHQLMKKSDESWEAGKERKSNRQYKRAQRKFDKARKIRNKKNN